MARGTTRSQGGLCRSSTSLLVPGRRGSAESGRSCARHASCRRRRHPRTGSKRLVLHRHGQIDDVFIGVGVCRWVGLLRVNNNKTGEKEGNQQGVFTSHLFPIASSIPSFPGNLGLQISSSSSSSSFLGFSAFFCHRCCMITSCSILSR